MIEDVYEFGNWNTGFPGPVAHGEFVPKITNGGKAHAGDTQVLAQGRGVFQVKLIKGNNAVDGLPAGKVTYGVDDRLNWQFFGHEKEFVDGFAWPVTIAKPFDCKEQNTAAQLLTGTQEFLAFFVRGDAEDSYGPTVGQEPSVRMFCHEKGVDARSTLRLGSRIAGGKKKL